MFTWVPSRWVLCWQRVWTCFNVCWVWFLGFWPGLVSLYLITESSTEIRDKLSKQFWSAVEATPLPQITLHKHGFDLTQTENAFHHWRWHDVRVMVTFAIDGASLFVHLAIFVNYFEITSNVEISSNSSSLASLQDLPVFSETPKCSKCPLLVALTWSYLCLRFLSSTRSQSQEEQTIL